MNNEISDKTSVLVTRSFGNIYITNAEAELIKAIIIKGVDKSLVLGGSLIMLNDVAGVTEGETIRNLEKTKRGAWKCKYDVWHEKNDQCGHDGKHW